METTNCKLISGKIIMPKIPVNIVLIISVITTFMLMSFKPNTYSETVKDADGNIYHTVKIGNQVWTVENLRTTKFNDGTPIPYVKDNEDWKKLNSPAYCAYDNDPENGKKYGMLYNWYAACSDKIAPKGWRVPTRDEQLVLRDYLIVNGYNYDGTTDGNKVAKSMASKTGWTYKTLDFYGKQVPDTIGMVGNKPQTNNKSGFSAVPTGSRWSDYSDGGFHSKETSVYWWSVTPYSETHAYHTSIHTFFANYGDNKHPKRNGFCIRLIRD